MQLTFVLKVPKCDITLVFTKHDSKITGTSVIIAIHRIYLLHKYIILYR